MKGTIYPRPAKRVTDRTTDPAVTRLGHEFTPMFEGTSMTSAANCTCGGAWSACEGNPASQTFAEWAMTHCPPGPADTPSYEDARKAYDVATALRQLADHIVRHPQLGVEMYGDVLFVPVVGVMSADDAAGRYRRSVAGLDGESVVPSKGSVGVRRMFGDAFGIEVGVRADVIEAPWADRNDPWQDHPSGCDTWAEYAELRGDR